MMNELLSQNMALYGTLLFFVALFVLVGISWTRAARQRRHTVWDRFAREHGFEFRQGDKLQVTGTVGDHQFSLHTERGGSDSGELGVADVLMSVPLRGAPAELVLESIPGMIGEVAKALEDNVVETGDRAFDEKMVIRQGSPETVRAYLDENRRNILMELYESAGAALIELKDGRLRLVIRERISSLSRLNALLDALIRAANRLESQPAHA